MKFHQNLSRVSFYKHSEDHLRVKTVHGGIVTLAGASLALFLLCFEAYRCLATRVDQSMVVDAHRDRSVRIEFEVSFPALPCQAIRIDAGDVSGKFETEGAMKVAKDGEVHKWQLDAQGNHLHRAEYIPPANHDNPFVLVINEDDMQEMRHTVGRHEGCNVQGWIDVERVAGNLHFAVRPEAAMAVTHDPGLLDALMQRHVEVLGAQADDSDAHLLNISHTIHKLRFGPAFLTQQHPLEGLSRIDRKATGVDKYFIKVVPTTFRSLWGRETYSNQYSVTEYYTRIPPGSRTLPGVYFLYDFWPIRVELTAVRLGILHLLVRASAVCGGVWALTRAADGVVHAAVQGLVAPLHKSKGRRRTGGLVL